MTPWISILMPPSTKRHQTELILVHAESSGQVLWAGGGKKKWPMGHTATNILRACLQASTWGCWIQDQSQAASASQASSGFCSNDCLILRSFKHVKTTDSRAAHLFNDHLNYTTGIYHKYKEKGEPLENQTWKISTRDQTAMFSAQGTGHCSLETLNRYSLLLV